MYLLGTILGLHILCSYLTLIHQEKELLRYLLTLEGALKKFFFIDNAISSLKYSDQYLLLQFYSRKSVTFLQLL